MHTHVPFGARFVTRSLSTLCLPLGMLLLAGGCPENHASESDAGDQGQGHTGQPTTSVGGASGTTQAAGHAAADGGGQNGSAGRGDAGKAGVSGAAGAAGVSGKAGSGGVAGKPSNAGNGAGGSAGQSTLAGRGAAGRPSTDDDAGVSKRCGTRGGVTCGDDQFCNFAPDANCGVADQGGACDDRPQVCTDIYKPVCGCDSHTYSSDCVAHAAGVSVKHDRGCSEMECTTAGGRPELSNGASTPSCKAGEESWAIGGASDGGLCCVPRQTGKTCGGIANLQCASGEFCDYESSAGGQGCNGKIADAGGTCQPVPKACTKELRQVCGCDHKSYSNACMAHTAGVSVLHDGACTESDCKALGGHAVAGIGPAPMCPASEQQFTDLVYDNGSMAIEGLICCLKQ